MPLEKIEEITPERHIVIWNVTESESELLNSIKLTDGIPEKLSHIKAPTKKLELLAVRACIEALSEELGFKFSGLEKNEFGKPILKGISNEISITHSYPYVAVIHDKSKEVGIDLEQPREKLIRISPKFLSESELKDANENIIKLCILWSAKEAMYKICSKKALIFNEQMNVEPFSLYDSGTITGYISTSEFNKMVKLHYRVNPNYVLVFNIN